MATSRHMPKKDGKKHRAPKTEKTVKTPTPSKKRGSKDNYEFNTPSEEESWEE